MRSDVAQAAPKAEITLKGDDIPFGAYQAIYHKLTKRVEKSGKVYNDAYLIAYSDLETLNSRITQLLKQYQIKAFRCEISHGFQNDQSRDHSSFEKFKISDCSVRSCTRVVNLQYDFLIILPPEVPEAEEIAQRYKVDIIVDQDFVEDREETPTDIFGEMFFGKNIRVVVEYSDYAVSQAIQSLLDGWVETLPSRKPGTWIKMLLAAKPYVLRFSGAVVYSAALIGGAAALSKDKDLAPSSATALLLFVLAVGHLSRSVVDAVTSRAFKILQTVRPITFILITEGDRDRQQAMARRNNKRTASISFLFVVVVLSLILNIFASWIYDQLT